MSASAQKVIDDSAASLQSGVNYSEESFNNPRGTTRDASASAQRGIDDTADSLKAGVDQVQDAVNNPRSAAKDTARSARSNVDDAADSKPSSLPRMCCLWSFLWQQSGCSLAERVHDVGVRLVERGSCNEAVGLFSVVCLVTALLLSSP